MISFQFLVAKKWGRGSCRRKEAVIGVTTLIDFIKTILLPSLYKKFSLTQTKLKRDVVRNVSITRHAG